MCIAGAQMSDEAWTLLTARGMRAFADGFVALLLPVYLLDLGFNVLQIGILTTATLLGSAALTLAVGLLGHRIAKLGEADPGRELMTISAFAWPLLIGGALKIASHRANPP